MGMVEYQKVIEEREREIMPRNRFWQYQALAFRDGEKCKSCGITGKELVIDHIDGNRQNENPANLRLLCRSCNRKNLIELHSEVREREGEKVLKDVVDYQSGTPEMAVNDFAEPEYRLWLDAKVKKAETNEKPLTKKEAINGGAEVCQVSTQATRRYLAKATSDEGPYLEAKDEWRQKVIRRRARQSG